MRKINSITQKHFLYFLLLFVLSILFVGWYSYYVAQHSILERTFNQLASVRVEKSRSVERFLSDRKNEIELFSKSGVFNDFSQSTQKGTLFESNLKLLFANGYYKKAYVVNPNREAIVIKNSSSGFVFRLVEDKNYLNDNKLDSLIEKIQASKNVEFQDYKFISNGEIAFYAGAPILYDLGSNGYYFIVELQIGSINKIMFEENENNGLGKSGESYIIGYEKLMRTSSRFKENSIKSIRVNTTAAENCLQGKSGNGIIDDYRGISVISSYSPFNIYGLRWSIIAEIDREEALEPIYNLRNSIIILCLIVSIFIFGLVYLGSLKITNPIIMLKDAAMKISKGDYHTNIQTKSEDEIGELISSFNNMAEQLLIQSEQIQKDKLLRISSMIDALEQERQRFSRDLHDGLGQMLLAIKIKIEQSKNSDKEKSLIYTNEAIELLKQTINEIRNISNDLRPNVLEMFGLKDGIKKLCRDSLQNSDIDFKFVCEDIDIGEMDSKKQIYIFRIVQEIINNILKHSAATEAEISLFNEGNNLIIKVADNGKGFDVSKKIYGNGINNIKERVELLKGSCEIISQLFEGTKYNIKIPV